MAKKSKVNKAATIRDYARDNPGLGPTEIANALNEQGLGTSPQQVSTTLSNERKKLGVKVSRKRRKKGAKRRAVSRQADSPSIDELVKAKRLAAQFGGVENAKRALDALSRLVD